MKRKIAIIGGTGDQGYGLALRWAKIGESIVIGSRVAAKAEEAAAKIKEKLGDSADVSGLENPQAAAVAAVVVLAVPFPAQATILKSIKNYLKAETILIDVTVPLASDFGGKPTRVVGVWQGSAAQQAAELAPKGTAVISAFHNVSAGNLQAIDRPLDCDIIVCGDSGEAKSTAKELIKKIPGAGYVDGGALENSRIVEQITALLIAINMTYKVHSAGLRISGLPPESPA
ncbi:MAG: NADPH-dependent F420 reductase [Acidobacteria bacterium]|nr:NADPH-dependent F420 reductase [Acidobacteriota bacterium]MBI3657184.1 NADPH-dependent F420 reductase [Acidobacteriota bacterium]